MSGNNSSRIKIIGLTGGIASGKNFVAEIFAQNGAAIFDADKEVHDLLALDKSTILEVKKNFPTSFVDRKIDRKILGKIIFSDKKKLNILEKIIHPRVRKRHLEFLQQAQKEEKKIAVLNVPLLLENKGYECDKIIAILVSPSIQKKRYLRRIKKHHLQDFASNKKSFEKKFDKINSLQITNSERKKLADFIVNTNASKADTLRQVLKIIKVIS